MTPEQEQAILKLAESFEKAAQKFQFGLEVSGATQKRWYQPKEFFLRLLSAASHAGPTEVQAICAMAHGSISLFGFAGTIRLALNLRRKYARFKKG